MYCFLSLQFVLSLKPDDLDEKLRSGGTTLDRGLSTAEGVYETDKSLWPLTKPLPKIEAIHQTSGEAQYVNDLPPQPHQVFCAFVSSQVHKAKIDSIDTTQALVMNYKINNKKKLMNIKILCLANSISKNQLSPSGNERGHSLPISKRCPRQESFH